MQVITLSLPGKPIAKARPRSTITKGRIKTYSSQHDEQETARWMLRSRLKGQKQLDGPLFLSTIFVFPKPKRWTKGKIQIYHHCRPDIDNLLKWFCDVGNGILWYDDCQIAECWATKLYGAKPCTIITVRKLDE